VGRRHLRLGNVKGGVVGVTRVVDNLCQGQKEGGTRVSKQARGQLCDVEKASTEGYANLAFAELETYCRGPRLRQPPPGSGSSHPSS
jgi:hypothetical protein